MPPIHALVALSLLLVPLAATAQGSGSREGRHRLDLSFHSHDASELEIYTALPAYTYTLGEQFRVGLWTSYSYLSPSDLGESLGIKNTSGLGDSGLNLQYTPSPQLTSSPWIPDTLGFNFGLTAPTGDADKGLSGDQWTYRIGMGWGYPVGENLLVLPSVQYEKSFSDGAEAFYLDYLGFSLGLNWIWPNGFWVGYSPYFQRDLVFYEWSDDHSIIIGKMWSTGFGISLEYGQAKRIDPSARRDDYTALLNLYYQFGSPP